MVVPLSFVVRHLVTGKIQMQLRCDYLRSSIIKGLAKMTRGMRLYDNCVYGVKVSKYGLEHGYLDYATLAKIIGDCILNNTVRAETMTDWEIVTGEFKEMIFQDYIISEQGYKFLADYTDEIVFYNEKLDLYIWGVTHFGTSWDYVLTDIKLVKECE